MVDLPAYFDWGVIVFKSREFRKLRLQVGQVRTAEKGNSVKKMREDNATQQKRVDSDSRCRK
jgi:hypothetical protein